MSKKAGILAPVSTLPGQHGIGDFGNGAFEFIDIISNNNFKIWQVLPLNPLGYGNSPYQPYSSYAGEELYISLDALQELGLIKDIEPYQELDSIINYDAVREFKDKYLRQAYSNINNSILLEEFEMFKLKVRWVNTYAMYITFKKRNNLKCWLDWKKREKDWIKKQINLKKHHREMDYEKFVQYIFYKQWFKLKEYASSKEITIMGDIPIYIGIDSADVWENPSCFLLENDGTPSFVAGVPPDYFSAIGQRWGNPIYNWDYLEKNNFDFWIERLKWNHAMYDIIRIDHFRAFDTYWKIPSSCPTAIEGEWHEAPGYRFFNEVYNRLPNINIVAEDLGELRPEVLKLRDFYKLSGMKVVQFELAPDDSQGIEYQENTIIYTGTHDNQTLQGWFSNLSSERQLLLSKQYNCDIENTVDAIIEQCFYCEVDLVIVPIQDILGLGDEAKLNTPGTVGEPNWLWKLNDYDLLYQTIGQYKSYLTESGRSVKIADKR